jgi:hypothetical protein
MLSYNYLRETTRINPGLCVTSAIAPDKPSVKITSRGVGGDSLVESELSILAKDSP